MREYIDNGYKRIGTSPYRGMRVHRYIMEKAIGRKLKKGEVVHHIDGNTLNNNLSNLALMSNGQHTTFHCKGRTWKHRGVIKLPKQKIQNEIVSLLRGNKEYRQYICRRCKNCGRLFWSRKDYETKGCNHSCAQIISYRSRK